MKWYVGIDLHSNNNYLVVINEADQVICRRRVANGLEVLLRELLPYQQEIEGIVVESTYNWYWLVDGLKQAGYRVHLANTAAIRQYEGLKQTDDSSDAFWRAHLLRLGILPEGSISPKENRPVRDLLRKRSQLVEQRTAPILSIENLITRNTGARITGNQVKALTPEDVKKMFPNAELALAPSASLAVMEILEEQIVQIEKAVKARARLQASFQPLLSVWGIGNILALTIMFETGDLGRLAPVGDYCSYCRCVQSQKLSNGKKKGENNTKHGNKYLAWAYVAAANFAARSYPKARSFVQRKKAQANGTLAIKALAHKLARASYYVMRDQVEFEPTQLFGS